MMWSINNLIGFFSIYWQKMLVKCSEIFYYFRMNFTDAALPQEHEKLKAIIFSQQEKLLEQQKTIEIIRKQYENLQHQIHCFLRKDFGRKSERGIPGQ